jgi:hypothetical protein
LFPGPIGGRLKPIFEPSTLEEARKSLWLATLRELPLPLLLPLLLILLERPSAATVGGMFKLRTEERCRLQMA